MEELRDWLSAQSGGLATFGEFQQRSLTLAQSQPDHSALFFILAAAAGRFVAAYDGLPLATGVAAEALTRLRTLVDTALGSLDGSAEVQLRTLNVLARTELAELS
ncbi:MAG TPA: hypothetical protein VND97_01360 [Beijerinckiaceae bacterium]|nr:hypothetical protein [Beijerinckiaceae bacterium]